MRRAALKPATSILSTASSRGLALGAGAAAEQTVRFAMDRVEDAASILLLLTLRGSVNVERLRQARMLIEVMRRATPIAVRSAGQTATVAVGVATRAIGLGADATLAMLGILARAAGR
jgi:hypothetical protein